MILRTLNQMKNFGIQLMKNENSSVGHICKGANCKYCKECKVILDKHRANRFY